MESIVYIQLSWFVLLVFVAALLNTGQSPSQIAVMIRVNVRFQFQCLLLFGVVSHCI